MSRSVQALLELLDLEVIEVDLYRGRSPETSLQRVFGGQVASQALVAVGRTVDTDRQVHSMHAYFLRPGDPSTPIVYHVDRLRDGRSFTTRRVVATQHGQAIFMLSASFQLAEAGLEHQEPMPPAPEPESVPTLRELAGEERSQWWEEWRSIDLRYAGGGQAWLRASDALPDDPLVHVCVLAYASDLTLLGSALVPHGLTPGDPAVQMASLDHAMWFHRPFRADGWLLHDQTSPSASGGRGLGSGRVFTRSGELVASVMQEGLIRPTAGRRPPAADRQQVAMSRAR